VVTVGVPDDGLENYFHSKMKTVTLLFFIFLSYVCAYQPIFGQQFTTLTSSNSGVSNCTMYFNFPTVQRNDCPNQENTSVIMYDYESASIYYWTIVDGENVDCYSYSYNINMSKFEFPNDLVWFGWDVVDGIECDQYIEYAHFCYYK
jgi:hypothetical protein